MDVKEPHAKYVLGTCISQTEIGELPTDWEVTRLGEIATIYDGTHQTPRYTFGGVPFYSVEQVTSGDFESTKFISEEEYLRLSRSSCIERGDVLMTRIGSIGDCKLIDWDVRAGYYVSLALLKFNESSLAAFFAQFSKTAPFKKEVELHSLAHAIPKKINLGPISDVRIPVPPVAERVQISQVLAEADALIESLSLLLAKKRQIKQGAMQELLTGKKRLPGFGGEWAHRTLEELADIRNGGTPSTTQDQFWNGDVLWCTPTDITALNGFKYLIDTARKLTSLGVQASAAELIPAGSIVMTSRATIGECAINTVAVTTNQGFKSFVPFSNVDTEYLYYLLQTQRSGFISLCSGSTFLEIGKTQLSVYGVFVPSEKIEQTAIAGVLAEMDEDIAVLESKITKARQLKQGMMQELLTGRIRLVQPVSNVIPLPTKTAEAKPSSPQPTHNWQINEAVVIGVLAQRFGSEKVPLGRKRRVKLMYLLHRHAEGRAEGYLKKAAGPYDPNTKYKGPEAIALKNGYVRALHNGTYEGFVAGAKAEQAQSYFEQWYGAVALEWLEQFHYRKTDDLELLATVDMAMVDLAAAGQPVNVEGVKRLIAAHPEWVPKLSRELFSDDNIAHAIAECASLFTA